jgi:hypothetical protein
MFKRKLMPLVAVLVLLLALPAQAVVITALGDPDSSGNYELEVDSDEMITFNGGKYAKYELVTTNDTLTAAESGTTYIVEGVFATSAITVLTLPDADVGLEYTFVIGGGMTVGVGQTGAAYLPDLYITPQSTDFFYEINSDVGSTYLAGQQVYSTGVTGDALHLICAKDKYWYAVDKVGTWTDGN